MLGPKRYLRHKKSLKAFLDLENELLFSLRKESKLTGSYGARFNQLSYLLSAMVELLSLKLVDRKAESQLLRQFSQNPDLFAYAASHGMKTSTYLAFERKSLEAQERILGKIEAFLLEDVRNDELIQDKKEIIQAGIAKILLIRYPTYELKEEEILTRLKPFFLSE